MAGYIETLEALKAHPAWKAPLGKNQGRGVASGYWFNGGGESSASVQINADGTILVATGSVDVGGSRASMAIMAAETFGVDYNKRAGDRRRHRVGRLHPRDRRLARHLCHRHRGRQRQQKGGRRIARPRRDDLGCPGRTGWSGKTGSPGRRAAMSAISSRCRSRRSAAKAAQTGGPVTTAALGQCRRPGARFCQPVLRCRGRSRDRQGDDPQVCRGPGCRHRDPPLLCRGGRSRAGSCRASAGP